MEAEAGKAPKAHQAELAWLVDEHGMAVVAKDVELKAVIEKSVGLERELETRGRVWAV